MTTAALSLLSPLAGGVCGVTAPVAGHVGWRRWLPGPVRMSSEVLVQAADNISRVQGPYDRHPHTAAADNDSRLLRFRSSDLCIATAYDAAQRSLTVIVDSCWTRRMTDLRGQRHQAIADLGEYIRRIGHGLRAIGSHCR